MGVLMGVHHHRKDDYAFFISPVDPARVPGYADVIKHPMDLGTMSTKVAKGKYRSLEEFTVSKTLQYFNPVLVMWMHSTPSKRSCHSKIMFLRKKY